MRYWDASALFPLVIEEPSSSGLHALLNEDSLIISWWVTPVECFSALSRSLRMKMIDEDHNKEIKNKLDHLVLQIDIISPTKILRERAIRLLNNHPLRAGDALQLASALHWCQEQPRDAGFVCLDERLRRAADAEGFKVLP